MCIRDRLANTLDIPLVLHGGSGAGEENIRKAVACGINKINVNTDVMAHAVAETGRALKENPEYGYMDLCMRCEDAMKDFIKSYMRMIGSSMRYTLSLIHILTEYLEDINVVTQSTSGSPVENMTLVEQDPANLGIVTIDGIYYAGLGEAERGFEEPLKNLRAIQVGHKAYLYGLTVSGTGVERYEDMAGKTVSVPPIGSTTYYICLLYTSRRL